MTRPTLSILASAYRTEPHLTGMIDSVLVQTSPDWELVIVDNGMSDEVAEILGHYADEPRIRLVRQEHRGPAGGVDAAAAAARGEYYAVVHSDGRVKPTFCERLLTVLAEHPEIDALGVDAFPFTDGGDLSPGFRERAGVSSEPGVDHRVTLAEVISGSTVLYSTAAIRAATWTLGGGYAGDTPQVESLAMFLRMLARGADVRVLPEQLAGYRLPEGATEESPVDRDEYEDSIEKAFVQAGALSSAPDVQEALDATLRRIRYEQAMRRAREALLASDARTAREQARLALAQRRALRPAVVYGALVVAPGLLRYLHPAKRKLSGLVGTVRRLVRR